MTGVQTCALPICYQGVTVSLNQTFTALSDSVHAEKTTLSGDKFQISIIDIGKWLQLRVETKVNIELILGFNGHLYCSYPFGAEKTTETQGHASRFLWDDQGYLFTHSGCPYFSRSAKGVHILIPEGEHTMMVARAATLLAAYRLAWEFAYPPVILAENPALPTSGEFIRGGMNFHGTVPIQLRRSAFGDIFSLLSIDGSLPEIPDAAYCDYVGHVLEPPEKMAPWTILNCILPLKDIFEKFPPKQKKK